MGACDKVFTAIFVLQKLSCSTVVSKSKNSDWLERDSLSWIDNLFFLVVLHECFVLPTYRFQEFIGDIEIVSLLIISWVFIKSIAVFFLFVENKQDGFLEQKPKISDVGFELEFNLMKHNVWAVWLVKADSISFLAWVNPVYQLTWQELRITFEFIVDKSIDKPTSFKIFCIFDVGEDKARIVSLAEIKRKWEYLTFYQLFEEDPSNRPTFLKIFPKSHQSILLVKHSDSVVHYILSFENLEDSVREKVYGNLFILFLLHVTLRL